MAKKKQKRAKRHRLELYFRVGRRLRNKPFFIALLSVVLLVITYLTPETIDVTWLGAEQRPFVVALIVVSGGLYVLSVFIGRVSVVQARRDYLYVRAGILPVAISYSRIRSLRPVQVGQQYPPKSLKRGEQALMEPFFALNAVAVDLRSFPRSEKSLRRLWSKFMFTSDEKGLLLIVKDARLLSMEIGEFRQSYLDRRAEREGESGDIFERVAYRQEHK